MLQNINETMVLINLTLGKRKIGEITKYKREAKNTWLTQPIAQVFSIEGK